MLFEAWIIPKQSFKINSIFKITFYLGRNKMSTTEPEGVEEKASPTTSIVFEASTQTPTNEVCDSPLFTQKGYCLKTTGHSHQALTNIHKMRQHGQVLVTFCGLLWLFYFFFFWKSSCASCYGFERIYLRAFCSEDVNCGTKRIVENAVVNWNRNTIPDNLSCYPGSRTCAGYINKPVRFQNIKEEGYRLEMELLLTLFGFIAYKFYSIWINISHGHTEYKISTIFLITYYFLMTFTISGLFVWICMNIKLERRVGSVILLYTRCGQIKV